MAERAVLDQLSPPVCHRQSGSQLGAIARIKSLRLAPHGAVSPKTRHIPLAGVVTPGYAVAVDFGRPSPSRDVTNRRALAE